MFRLFLATEFSLLATNLTQLHSKADSGNTFKNVVKTNMMALCPTRPLAGNIPS